jgi:hypothetical protein
MKKKQFIISISLLVTVLLSILLVTSYLWAFVKFYKMPPTSTMLLLQTYHHHHSFDDCKVCHFTFGSYISQSTSLINWMKTSWNVLFFLKQQRSLFHFLEACIPSVLRQWKLGLTFSRYHFFLFTKYSRLHSFFEDCRDGQYNHFNEKLL